LIDECFAKNLSPSASSKMKPYGYVEGMPLVENCEDAPGIDRYNRGEF